MLPKRSQRKRRNAVVVLGMHRSGTSALGGVLARLGCDLPKTLMEANEFNTKGYYESLKIYAMNDAILALGGSSWDDWQQFHPNWIETPRAAEYLARGKDVLEAEYGESSLFLVKDPRICRLMPFWSRLFENQSIEPIYIHAHRNPLDVAKSLQRREGWSVAYGLLLWLSHVLDAESGSRGAKRCFTSYDRQLGGWASILENVQKNTGLTFPRLSDSVDREIEDFLSVGLSNSSSPAEIVKANPLTSNWVRKAFEILERWADAGEDEAGLLGFDTIRSEFNAAAPMFNRLVQESLSATKHEKAMEVTVVELAEVRPHLHSKEEELQASNDKVGNLGSGLITKI